MMEEQKAQICIIDRFEGDWAVIEYGDRTFDFPKHLLPCDAKEGDVLRFKTDVDVAETEKRQREVEELTRGLFVDEPETQG